MFGPALSESRRGIPITEDEERVEADVRPSSHGIPAVPPREPTVPLLSASDDPARKANDKASPDKMSTETDAIAAGRAAADPASATAIDSASLQRGEATQNPAGLSSEPSAGAEPGRAFHERTIGQPAPQQPSLPPIHALGTRHQSGAPGLMPTGVYAADAAATDPDHPMSTQATAHAGDPPSYPDVNVAAALRVLQADLARLAEGAQRGEGSGGEPVEARAVRAASRSRTDESIDGQLVLPARARPHQVPPARGDEAPAAGSTEPIIQVTIGKIEVRASTSAGPRPRPKPPRGTTSLDDYLRQRSGRSGA